MTAAAPASLDGSRNAREDTVIVQAAAVLTLAGGATFAGVFLARGGFGDSVHGVAMLFALSLLPIWVSAAAVKYFGYSTVSRAVALLCGFLVSLLLPLASLAAGHIIGVIACVLLLAALLAQARNLWQAMRRHPVAIILSAVLFAALWVFFTALSRLFLPEAVTLGLALADNYYNLSIAQMLDHYGAISTGADGLTLHAYHFLSHLIAAGLSRAVVVPMPLVYLYWGALTLKLQLAWCVFMAGVLIVPPTRDTALLRLFYAAIVLLLVQGFESESFLQGAALYAAALPLLLALATNKNTQMRRLVPALVFAVIAVLFCGLAKISAGFFAGIALLAVLWNVRDRPIAFAVLLTGMVVITLPIYLLVLPRDLSRAGFSLLSRAMDYYQNYVSLTTLLSYLTPLLVVTLLQMHLRFVREPGRTLTIHWKPFVAGEGKFGEGAAAWLAQCDPAALIASLSVLACVAVLFTMPIGSNVAYFSMYIYLLGLLLLPLALCKSAVGIPRAPLTSALGLVLCAALLICSIPFMSNGGPFLSALYRAASGEGPRYNNHVLSEIRHSLRQTGKPFATLQARIAQTPWAIFIAELNRQAASVNGRLAVQIAPSSGETWHRLKDGTAYWCIAPHLMIPAQAGLAEIRSIAPMAIEQECWPYGAPWYGFGTSQNQHRAAELSKDQLCRLAAPLRARAVYRLASYRDLSRNAFVRCEAR